MRSAGRDPVIATWATIAVFLSLLAILAWRLGAGQDPGLASHGASAARPVRRVLVRRVYERVVVVHLPLHVAARRRGSSQQVLASPAPVYPTAVTRTS